MLELKIIKAANRIYRGVIRLSLRSVNMRDKRALKNLDSKLDQAKRARIFAAQLHTEADNIEDTAHVNYSRKQRNINSAYNLLENALDDGAINF